MIFIYEFHVVRYYIFIFKFIFMRILDYNFNSEVLAKNGSLFLPNILM